MRSKAKLRQTDIENRITSMYEVAIKKLMNKLLELGFLHKNYTPKAQKKWIHLKPEELVLRYNRIMAGILNYYSFVENRNMLQRLVWGNIKYSATLALVRKWNISPRQVQVKKSKSKSSSLIKRGKLASKPFNCD